MPSYAPIDDPASAGASIPPLPQFVMAAYLSRPAGRVVTFLSATTDFFVRGSVDVSLADARRLTPQGMSFGDLLGELVRVGIVGWWDVEALGCRRFVVRAPRDRPAAERLSGLARRPPAKASRRRRVVDEA